MWLGRDRGGREMQRTRHQPSTKGQGGHGEGITNGDTRGEAALGARFQRPSGEATRRQADEDPTSWSDIKTGFCSLDAVGETRRVGGEEGVIVKSTSYKREHWKLFRACRDGLPCMREQG